MGQSSLGGYNDPGGAGSAPVRRVGIRPTPRPRLPDPFHPTLPAVRSWGLKGSQRKVAPGKAGPLPLLARNGEGRVQRTNWEELGGCGGEDDKKRNFPPPQRVYTPPLPHAISMAIRSFCNSTRGGGGVSALNLVGWEKSGVDSLFSALPLSRSPPLSPPLSALLRKPPWTRS